MSTHIPFMERCIALARMGEGHTAPNPMVGCVIVHEGRIIGEGYHRKIGGPHAEVEALDSVLPEHRPMLRESTLYVSLEPCSHHGRTPPCADRIVAEGIPKVVIATTDPNPRVGGRGLARLREAGVEVVTGVLEKEARALNRPFFTFHTLGRPHYTLKWARSSDGFIGRTGDRTQLSSAATNRLIHRWRAEHMAIMVGTNTAIVDDPSLTLRHWPGRQPLRIVTDRQGRMPHTLKLFTDGHPTLLLHDSPSPPSLANVEAVRMPFDEGFMSALDHALLERGIQSVLVEGGAQLLGSFIKAGHWDECRTIETPVVLGEGVVEPEFHGKVEAVYEVDVDVIRHSYKAR
jgi:diaminohydroxyphosphoribosylaminopyrimidine deaminase / 5-amino-6-(5-phosphoribosylamino)uracil reductase